MFFLGLAIGTVITWLYFKNKVSDAAEIIHGRIEKEKQELREEIEKLKQSR